MAFDYLLEPDNRPEWQSSLRAVVRTDPGPPVVGLRWLDVTVPGVRPAMEISAADRPHSWTEVGRWRGIEAELTLDYEPTATGCRVRASFSIVGHGLLRPAGPLLGLAGLTAVGPDLKRAARILSERSSGK